MMLTSLMVSTSVYSAAAPGAGPARSLPYAYSTVRPHCRPHCRPRPWTMRDAARAAAYAVQLILVSHTHMHSLTHVTKCIALYTW